MQSAYGNLKQLIRICSMKQNIHICIHDISGILQTPQLAIPYENTMHSKNFCNTAKSTAKGYGLCITCKVLANKKALKDRKLFYGHCPFGLFEIACPVILNDEVLAIVYVGNLMVTKETSHRKLQSACNITGVSKEKLLSLTDSTEKVSDFSEYISMTEFITSYISLICKTNDRKNLNKPLHWSIEISKAYAENNFDKNITLKELANLYYINEKYLGRLYKKQIGKSFSEYLNDIRLSRAKQLLTETQHSVIEIAFCCGYQNVSYFNRVFKRNTGLSPTQFRKLSPGYAKE